MSDSTWIFGYGSLIWRPGFAHMASRPARLEGYHRAFCRYSFRHRGTPEAPGLVIGLKQGGACEGMAYAVSPDNEAEALAYLDEREGAGYHRHRVPVLLHARNGDGPQTVDAWTYIPNTSHPSYFGNEDPEQLVRLVATGKGESGTALDYLKNLVEQLAHLNVPAEPELLEVLKAAEAWEG